MLLRSNLYPVFFLCTVILGLVLELCYLHLQVERLQVELSATHHDLLERNDQFLSGMKEAVALRQSLAERKMSAFSSFWSDYAPWIAGVVFVVLLIGGSLYLYSSFQGGGLSGDSSNSSNLSGKSLEKSKFSDSTSGSSSDAPEIGSYSRPSTDSSSSSPIVRESGDAVFTSSDVQSLEIVDSTVEDLVEITNLPTSDTRVVDAFTQTDAEVSPVLESMVEGLAETPSTTHMMETSISESFTQTELFPVPPHEFITHEDVIASIAQKSNNTTFLVDNYNTRYLLKIYPMGESAHPLQGGLEIFFKAADHTVYTKAQNLGEVYMRFMESGPPL